MNGSQGPVTTQADEGPIQRLRELHRMVMDPNATFSISATLGELEMLEPKLPRADGVARGELNYLRGFVLYRGGREEEALAPSMEALRIDAICPFLTASERAHFAYSLAHQAEAVGAWDIAINAYRQAILLLDTDPELSDDQRLGVRESLAFCLHEAGRYGEAFSLNEEVLAGGERLFGKDSDKLLVVVTNLAQNAHKLNDPDRARHFLMRRLRIASIHRNATDMDDSLFQLGVLAFEQGWPDEAEMFMRRRLDFARASNDPERIESAQEDLQILHAKMAGESRQP